MFSKVAHSAWSNNGFLSITNVDPLMGIGALDFAGSGVVHLTGKFNSSTTCHSNLFDFTHRLVCYRRGDCFAGNFSFRPATRKIL